MAHATSTSPPAARGWLGYTALLTGGVLVFAWLREAGEGLTAPAATALARPAGEGAGGGSGLLGILVALLAVVVASRAVGTLFRWMRQPAVLGEVLAGILLGPSLLGSLAPGVSRALFPQAVVPQLGVIAQLGVLLFMFVMGLELDSRVLRRDVLATMTIAHSGIVVPFLLGAASALWLYPVLSPPAVPFTAFALFLGVSMSVTAFPVLARILAERGMQQSRLGTISLTCAAWADVTAWCLLAVVVGAIQARMGSAVLTVGLTAAFIAGMWWLGRPLARRFAARFEGKADPGTPAIGAVSVMLLVCGLATEYIGIHTLFGAFMLGAVIPHDSTLARTLRDRLHDLVLVLFLPAFFAYSGLRTRLDLLQPDQWGICAALVGLACAGKFGGTALAARWTGMTWRDSSVLGVLMNTRGLMELIVLNVGLELGVISPPLFAMLVVMALVTTFAAGPLLDLAERTGPPARADAPAP